MTAQELLASNILLQGQFHVHVGPSNSAQPPAAGTGEAEDAESASGMQPFARLTKAAVEALRYRGEDIARSITKTVVKEVSAPSYCPQ